jgi:uncharacterized membrane protein YecN with MAPEG domain
MITGFYAGILALWLVFLILSVVRLRWKYRVGLGDGGEKELTRAIRIHGNFIETVPLLVVMMGMMEMWSILPIGALHAFGAVLVLSRLLHWHGLTSSATTSFGRTAGTVLVCLLLVVGAGAMICAFARELYVQGF